MKTQSIEVTQRRTGPFSRSQVLEFDGIELRSVDHFTRLSPATKAMTGAFRVAMLPIRLTALAVLWATANPTRLFASVAVGAVLGVWLGRG